MRLTYDDKKVLDVSPLVQRIREGEKNIERVEIIGKRDYEDTDLCTLSWTIQGAYVDYSETAEQVLSAQAVENSDLVSFLWVPDEQFSAHPGDMRLTLVGNGNKTIKIVGSRPITIQENRRKLSGVILSNFEKMYQAVIEAIRQTAQSVKDAIAAQTAATRSASAAAASETAAQASAGAAADSATAAAGSANAAKSSEDAASQSQTSAAASASAAADSKTAAAGSAAEAKASETAAKASETNAAASQSAATNSAAAAKTSEDNAAASKTAAASSASAAKASETAAAASKTAAKSSEDNALASKTAAAGSASAAAGSATAAKSSETAAAKSATAAAGSATTAKSSETAATASKDAAAGSAAAAKISEDNAAASKTAAAGSAAAAKNSETAAAASKTAAASSATAAKTSETAAAASATAAAKSAEEAKIAAGGGVLKFNGRTGEVVPQAGDYTAAQVGAVATSGGELAKTKVTYTTPKSGAPASGETMEVIMAKVTAMYNRMVEIEAALPPIGDWVLAEDRIVYDSGGVNGRTYPWVNFDDNLDPAVYPKLYAKIGTKWSSGAPSGYFNLALLKDRFPLVSSSNFSKTGGEEKHKLTTQELPPSWVDIYFEDLQSMSEEAHNYIKNIGWSKTCKKATFGEFNTGDYGAKGTPHNNMPPYARVIVHIRAG